MFSRSNVNNSFLALVYPKTIFLVISKSALPHQILYKTSKKILPIKNDMGVSYMISWG